MSRKRGKQAPISPVDMHMEGVTMDNLQKSPPDYGTAELHKRHAVVLEGDSRRSKDGADSHHARVVDQRVIDRLWRNGRIDGKQRWAARKLFGSFTRAGMEARLVVQLGAQRTGGTGRNWSNAQLEARDETNAALKAIAPLNDVVWEVVLADKGLVEVEIARKWRSGTAWVILDMGLDSLAAYYEAKR